MDQKESKEKYELSRQFGEWCVEFKKAKIEPMSDSMAKAFIKLIFAEMKGEEKITSVLEKGFAYQVLDKRAKFINLRINKYAKALLCCLCRTPGTIVMYLYYLKSRQEPGIEINIEQIAHIFPMGFPSEEALDKVWDLQKVRLEGSDNLLDHVRFEE